MSFSNPDKMKKKPTTVKIAMWSARHPWLVGAVWFGLTALVVGVGLRALGTKTQAFNSTGLPTTESGKASQAITESGAALLDTLILDFNYPTLKVTDPAYGAAVENAAARLKTVTYTENGKTQPAFSAVLDYYSSQNPALASADSSTTRIMAPMVGNIDNSTPKYLAAKSTIEAIKQQHKDFAVFVYSWASGDEEINELISQDLDGSLKITMPLTFLILLIAFGTVGAAIVPLVLSMLWEIRLVVASHHSWYQRKSQ